MKQLREEDLLGIVHNSIYLVKSEANFFPFSSILIFSALFF
jgi:hypothetical protein